MIVIEMKKSLQDESGRNFSLCYRMLKESVNLEFCNRSLQIPSYGIEIESEFDSEKYINISPNQEKVSKILERFYENGVSPIHLNELIEEDIEEYIKDYDKECLSLL